MVNALFGFAAMISFGVTVIGCVISLIRKKPAKPWLIAIAVSVVVIFAALVTTPTGDDTPSEVAQPASDDSRQTSEEPVEQTGGGEKEEIKAVVESYVEDGVVTVVESDDGTFFVGVTAIDFQRFIDKGRCAEFAAQLMNNIAADSSGISGKINTIAIGMRSGKETISVSMPLADYLAGGEIVVTSSEDARIAEEERRYADALEKGKATFAEAYLLYKENPLRADEKYKGKRLTITGTVVGMEDGGIVNIGGGATLTIRSDVETSEGTVHAEYVAEFEKDEVESIKSINIGDEIVFEGEYSDIGWWDECELK